MLKFNTNTNFTYHSCFSVPAKTIGVYKSNLITLHTQKPLGHHHVRVIVGPNDYHITGDYPPKSMGHAFGQHHIAAEIEGREHTGTVRLQAPECRNLSINLEKRD